MVMKGHSILPAMDPQRQCTLIPRILKALPSDEVYSATQDTWSLTIRYSVLSYPRYLEPHHQMQCTLIPWILGASPPDAVYSHTQDTWSLTISCSVLSYPGYLDAHHQMQCTLLPWILGASPSDTVYSHTQDTWSLTIRYSVLSYPGYLEPHYQTQGTLIITYANCCSRYWGFIIYLYINRSSIFKASCTKRISLSLFLSINLSIVSLLNKYMTTILFKLSVFFLTRIP